MSTLTSADMVHTRSSTRVHAPPGGKTSINLSSHAPDSKAAAPKPAPVDTKVPASPTVEVAAAAPPTPSAGKLSVGVAAVEGSPLLSATLASLQAQGATVSSFTVHDVLALPFAVDALLKGDGALDAVIVLGQLLETELWCSREIVSTVHTTLLNLGLSRGTPVVMGLNYDRLPAAQLDAQASRLVAAAAKLSSADLSAPVSRSPLPGGDKLPRTPVSTAPASPLPSSAASVSLPADANLTALLEALRNALKKHGAQGMCGLARKFRVADTDGSGKLDRAEVTRAFAALKLAFTPAQLDEVISFFDKDGDGQISHKEFLVGVRGEMNERRRQLVLAAFGLMDADKSGVLDARDLRSRYDVSRHPDVMSGRKDRDEAMADFLNTFDVGNKDGKVTPAEWVEYYANVSASIDDEDHFELMMRNAWRMSGGQGFAANTANRRVLVTHADGRQTVEEIKNDLGIKGDDVPAMMANLKQQGINAVSIDLFGGTKSTSPPLAASAAPTGASPSRNRQAPGGKSNLVLG